MAFAALNAGLQANIRAPSTTQTYQFLAYADGAAESDETITSRLNEILADDTGQNFTIGTPSTATVTIRGTDSTPSFGAGSVTAKTFTAGAAIAEFQVPAATGGNGGITYAASGLPAGLRFDATGTDTPGCPGTEPHEVCGTPTTATSGAQTVTITAIDADSNTMSTDRDTLTFSVTVNAGASLASSPATLTEANLDGAMLTVTLAGVTYAAGVSATSFQLVTSPTIAGLSIGSVTGGATGTTTATLTLAAGTGYGFDAATTLAVRVLAAAHSGSTNLTLAVMVILGLIWFSDETTIASPGMLGKTLPRGQLGIFSNTSTYITWTTLFIWIQAACIQKV